ncbi:hypothetical protein B0H17DRAFT_1112287 [Mycena rosella]|uniref:Uncharacterized protein n=1 Tax=Mycena rosella TaxID=1033263 RepID=A0AAD7FGG9_MYCRO|nr:hypothetical protein B0H17DRAFT_1112287 [Mycena rosella]
MQTPHRHPGMNRPPSSPGSSTPTPGSQLNARSLAQAERCERERQQRAAEPLRPRKCKRPARPESEGPPNARQLAQRKRRERERVDEENRIRAPSPPRASQAPNPNSRVLREFPNGLLTPPATQRAVVQRRVPQIAGAAAGPLMAARREYNEPESRHDLGPMNVSCPHCAALHWADECVSGSSKYFPEFGICCNHSKVQLRPPSKFTRRSSLLIITPLETYFG